MARECARGLRHLAVVDLDANHHAALERGRRFDGMWERCHGADEDVSVAVCASDRRGALFKLGVAVSRPQADRSSPLNRRGFYALKRLRLVAARPSRPVIASSAVPGSGTVTAVPSA